MSRVRRRPAGKFVIPKLDSRDHDELRYSIRSILHYFKPYLSSVHLVTSDLTAPLCGPQISHRWRLGHIPQWLDLDGIHSPQLNIWHHAEIFDNYVTSSFNSYAIGESVRHGLCEARFTNAITENQLKNIPKLSENLYVAYIECEYVPKLMPQ